MQLPSRSPRAEVPIPTHRRVKFHKQISFTQIQSYMQVTIEASTEMEINDDKPPPHTKQMGE